MALKNGAPRTGGTFFRAKDHASAAALLIETTGETQATKWKSQETEPAAVATITVFSTPAALDSGEPSEILDDAIVQGALGRKFLAAKTRQGDFDELAGKLEKVSLSNGNDMWDLISLADDSLGKLQAYLDSRNEDLPDWAK